jgi:uncharacterized membrane protein
MEVDQSEDLQVGRRSPRGWIADLWHLAVVRLFIDSLWTHRWHCHRLPERSFHTRGRQFHLCARCTGLAAGLILAFPAAPFVSIAPAVIAGASALLVTDAATQLAGWRSSTNVLRVATGLAAGFSVGLGILNLAMKGW